MAAPTKVSIKTEISDASPLAVVYGKSKLGEELRSQLLTQKIRVVSLPHSGDVFSILERPGYIFLFVSDITAAGIDSQMREAFQSGFRSKARIFILFFENSPEFEIRKEKIAEEVGVKTTTIELQGGFLSQETLQATAAKIIRLAFSQQDYRRQVFFGENKSKSLQRIGNDQQKRNTKVDPEKIIAHLEATRNRQRRWSFWSSLGFSPRVVGAMLLITLVVTLIMAPFFWLGVQTATGIGELVSAKSLVLGGNFEAAQQKTLLAKSRFLALKDFTNPFVQRVKKYQRLNFLIDYYRFLDLLDQSSDTIQEMIDLGPTISKLPGTILSRESEGDLEKTLTELKVSLPLIDEQLGLLQAKADEALSGEAVTWLRFFGFPQQKLLSYKEMLPQARKQIVQAEKLLKILPDLVAVRGEKTYLVIFQNSAELRATGGFVGSYALVKFRQGKLIGYKVFDVYSADGQLRGQVSPPDEILHYLGQPNWFMRDANFSPDFPLTAKRLEWFLEKETNQKVDGVIGIDIGAVQKLLMATGPVSLPDFDDLVGAEDFYHKTQYQAEINFFPGSTKKRDYLGAVAEAIIQKLVSEPNKSWIKLSTAVQQAFAEKNVMVYFDNELAQEPFFEYGWSGSLKTGYCGTSKANCLMVVESNFGLNKANFFIQRDYSVQMVVDRSGGVDVSLIMHIANDSPSESWPGGKYKNYLRFLVPNGSKVNGLTLGDERKATESAVLTAEILQAVSSDQFLVVKTGEQTYIGSNPVASGLTSYGFMMELPVGSRREIVFRYKPPYRMSLESGKNHYEFGFLKQPGTGAPVTDLSLEYPSFLKPVLLSESSANRKYDLVRPEGAGPLLFSQKIIFNTDLASDRFLTVEFKK